jgi:hypothetical protein
VIDKYSASILHDSNSADISCGEFTGKASPNLSVCIILVPNKNADILKHTALNKTGTKKGKKKFHKAW